MGGFCTGYSCSNNLETKHLCLTMRKIQGGGYMCSVCNCAINDQFTDVYIFRKEGA